MRTKKAIGVSNGGNTTAQAYGPQWIGIPSRGHCTRYGLSRPHYYQLIEAGTIRSACLRKPGASRGRRLVFAPSVEAYLNQCADAESVRLTNKAEKGAVQ
jgi:hypothetical protein